MREKITKILMKYLCRKGTSTKYKKLSEIAIGEININWRSGRTRLVCQSSNSAGPALWPNPLPGGLRPSLIKLSRTLLSPVDILLALVKEGSPGLMTDLWCVSANDPTLHKPIKGPHPIHRKPNPGRRVHNRINEEEIIMEGHKSPALLNHPPLLWGKEEGGSYEDTKAAGLRSEG